LEKDNGIVILVDAAKLKKHTPTTTETKFHILQFKRQQ